MAFSFTVTDAGRIATIDLIGNPSVLPGWKSSLPPNKHTGKCRPGDEIAQIKAKVGPLMLTHDAFHWDWYHLGLADFLDAVRARLHERAGHPDIAAEHYARPAARARNTAGRDYLTKQAA